ncbi:hypothetical protein COOONC_19070 [Cooperia oncophora]
MSSSGDVSSADDVTTVSGDSISQHEEPTDSASVKALSLNEFDCNSSTSSSMYRTIRSDIVHPNVERSLGESFSMRRSPKDSPGRWTDIFTSKRIRKKIHKHFRESHVDDDRSPTDEMVCATQELRSLSPSELNGRFVQVMRDRNIDQKKIDDMLLKMADEQKRLILTQHLKTDVSGTKKVGRFSVCTEQLCSSNS